MDGAAFEADVGKVMRYLAVSNRKCVLFAPESFEYLLLTADIFDVPKAVLEETYNFADSEKLLSWEEYFTDYIVQHSVKTAYKYSKTKLNDYYKAPKVIEKIKHVLPEQIV